MGPNPSPSLKLYLGKVVFQRERTSLPLSGFYHSLRTPRATDGPGPAPPSKQQALVIWGLPAMAARSQTRAALGWTRGAEAKPALQFPCQQTD